MEGCGEGGHEERQEEGGAPALPVQMRLKLLLARVGERRETQHPSKMREEEEWECQGWGGGGRIVYT